MQRQYWILAVYFLLVVTGIPWYWPDDVSRLVLGLPAWFFVTILVSFCASVFTAFILLRYPWKTEEEPDE